MSVAAKAVTAKPGITNVSGAECAALQRAQRKRCDCVDSAHLITNCLSQQQCGIAGWRLGGKMKRLRTTMLIGDAAERKKSIYIYNTLSIENLCCGERANVMCVGGLAAALGDCCEFA